MSLCISYKRICHDIKTRIASFNKMFVLTVFTITSSSKYKTKLWLECVLSFYQETRS